MADSSTTLDYYLTVGQNSVASLGTADNSEAETYFRSRHKSWGEKGMTTLFNSHSPLCWMLHMVESKWMGLLRVRM